MTIPIPQPDTEPPLKLPTPPTTPTRQQKMNRTRNFKTDILAVLAINAEVPEDIEAVVIDNCTLDSYFIDTPADPRDIPKELESVPLSWERISPFLDYSYDPGYGCGYRECHTSIRVYTKYNIYYISEYDGSVRFNLIERNPS